MQTIDRFYRFAADFCEWAEGEPSDVVTEAETARRLLAYLSALALELPLMSGEVDVPELPKEKYMEIYDRFASLPFKHYWSIYNPFVDPPDEPVRGDLADDLADVYRDLRRGVWCYDNDHTDAAVWEWRFHFTEHWGRHAASALYALQAWLANR